MFCLFRPIGSACAVIVVIATVGCSSQTLWRGTEPSPDGKFIADWYLVSGGGGAGWSRDEVRLRRSEDPVSAAQVVFVGHADRLVMRWSDSSRLDIDYPSGTGVFRSEAQWNGVSIHPGEDPKLERWPGWPAR